MPRGAYPVARSAPSVVAVGEGVGEGVVEAEGAGEEEVTR